VRLAVIRRQEVQDTKDVETGASPEPRQAQWSSRGMKPSLHRPLASPALCRVAPAAVATLLAVLALAPVPRVLAASPTPPPVDPFPTIETWIDAPIAGPPDAPAGGLVSVGATFWNARDNALFGINGLNVKLYPKTGSAKPSVAKAIQDFPGHILAQLPIPQGGIGRVEIVASGQECAADGSSCHDVDIPLKIAGTGPPPDAPPGKLVTAELLPITGDAVAGRPVSIAVLLHQIGLWTLESFPLPDSIEVTSTKVGGGRLGSARLQQDPPIPSQPYRGTIRIPEPGNVVLAAAFVDSAGRSQPIQGVLGPIQVIGTAVRADGASPLPLATAGQSDAAAPGDPGTDAGPPWVPIALVVVLILGLALFLGEPLTRRFRRGRDADRR
jgi:hypothetical protein